MSDLHQPQGPSPESFKKLKKQLPSFREEVERKRLRSGATPIQDLVPKKICEVCGKGFEWTQIKGPLPELAVCDKCQKKLDEGYTALKSDNRYAFIKSQSLADWAGQIHQVSPPVMDNIQKTHLGEVVETMIQDKSNEPSTPGAGQNPELN